MESSFQELEEKYDIEKLSSDKKTMEIKALSAIKDKYAVYSSKLCLYNRIAGSER